ncbi:MAG: hypothetical protein ACI8QZ_003865, partial [Chlamydiales bacterium]
HTNLIQVHPSSGIIARQTIPDQLGARSILARYIGTGGE